MKFKIGDFVITTGVPIPNEEPYEKGLIGIIIENDESDIPYAVYFGAGEEDWEWCYEPELESYKPTELERIIWNSIK